MLLRTCMLLLLSICSLSANAQQHSSYLEQINSAKKLKDFEAAQRLLDSLVTLADAGDIKDTLGLLYHTKGVFYHWMQDWESAIATTLQAVALRKVIGDTTGLGQSNYNIAYFYEEIDEPQQAIEYHEETILLGKSPANKYYINSLIAIVPLERDEGDYGRAISHSKLAIEFLKSKSKLSAKDSLRFGMAYVELGSVQNLLANVAAIKASLVNLNKALELLEPLEPSETLSDCYKELGNSYAALKEPIKAIQYYERMIPIFQRDEDWDQLGGTYNNIGSEYRKMHKFKKAIYHLEKGLQYYEKEYGKGFHYRKAMIADNLADTYRDQGQFEKAMRHYHEAIQHALPSFRSADYHQNPSPQQLQNASDKESLLTYLGDKAQGWQAFYESTKDPSQLQQALSTLELADLLIDEMRREHTAEESKLIWRRKVHDIYETALAIAFSLDDKARAFYFFEKSKSILLLDGLMAADARSLISDSLAQQERTLVQEIIELNEALEEQPNDQALRTQKLIQEKQLQEFVEQLAASNPKYHELRYAGQVTTLEATQNGLAVDHAMIEYFFGAEAIYAMAITPDAAELVAIEKDSLLTESMARLIAQFQEASAIINDPGQFASEAYALYALLLEPVLQAIPSEKIQKLCLVLDGPLQYLPFEALLYEPPTRYNLSLLPYLIRKYELRYAYSATILAKQQSLQTKAANAQIFGVAPFAKNTGALGQLPFSAMELKSIKDLAKGRYLFDDEASSIAFRQNGPLFQVLHLSTHASANDASAKPFIYFADQKLYLSDLYTLELPADLVVLSACETGLGKVQTGEGVMSLSRGFTYAGAKSLISSLWSVNDQSTADIFTAFYQKLRAGDSKASALHQSKLDYLTNTELTDDQKSPYYWAGFVYVGGDGALALESAGGLRGWMLVIGLFLIAGVAIALLRRKRNNAITS